MELFEQCRERLWVILQNMEWEHHKSYEGAIEVNIDYDNFFSSPDAPPPPDCVTIILHCYVLGDMGRHHEFQGKTLESAAKKFSKWLDHEEEKYLYGN